MEKNETKQSAVEIVNKELLDEIFNVAGDTQNDTPPVVVKEEESNNLVDEVINGITPPITPEPPKTTEVVEAPKVQTDFSKKLKGLIKDGIIENFAISYDVDGESQETYIEDIEDLTEEGYQQIIAGWKQAKDEDIKSKYISVDGLDETTKKLIEIKRAGGDISEVIQRNVSAIEQLTNLKENIDNEQVQINIVAHQLQQQGIKPSVVKAQIKELIDEGLLEGEATTILDSHLQAHQQEIENKKNTELQREQQEKEDLKNLRKTLAAKYKEANIPENLQKVLVDNATKLDQDKISNTDKLYFEAIKDPEKLWKLNFFLNNPEEFEKFISSKKVLKAKTDTISPLFKINLTKTNKPRLSATSLDEMADEIIKQSN